MYNDFLISFTINLINTVIGYLVSKKYFNADNSTFYQMIYGTMFIRFMIILFLMLFLISFSYGRALQQSALKNWAKNINDTNNTQKIFNHRSKMNGLSTSAKWSIGLEKQINA